MKRFTAYIISGIALMGCFTACEHKELFLHSTRGNVPIQVVIHWDSVPDNKLSLPRDMTVHWYPETGSLIASDMGVYGGHEWLNENIYDVMCMDFNGNSNLAFRSNGTRPDFEAYNIRTSGTYNVLVPQLPGGEVTVAEAVPYHFYIDSRSQDIDTRNIPAGDTLTVHFYPKDVLREFTFLIYDVTGAKNIASSSGAISGMSASYFPAAGNLAASPSTILFQRVQAIPDAQTSNRWTDKEKELFAAKNPDWASSDTTAGWTRDWVTGKFVTFGPLDRNENRFRLTVEAFNRANNGTYGAWGYWNGQWENTVAAQIDSAMGRNGTLEEQLAWRQRNGGYDIILFNDHRLTVPEGEGGNTTDGGFNVSVDDWGPMIEVPLAGSSSGTRNASALRAAVNTLETVSHFIVNGVWKEDGWTIGGEWSCLFNAQWVYKPEDPMKAWDYSPKKYWPSSGEVDFYAYAPGGLSNSNLKTGLFNNGNDTLLLSSPAYPVLEYIMPFKNDSLTPPPGTGEPNPVPVVDEIQDDLLVAVQNSPSPPLPISPVPMNFHHAFSRVSVKARIAPTDYSKEYRIKVTRVDLHNLCTRGKLELKPDAGSTFSTGIPMNDPFIYDDVHPVILWTDLDSLANYRFKLLSTTVISDDDYAALVHSNDGVFVMPQIVDAANKTALYVEYNIYTYSVITGEQYVTSATKLFPFTDGFAFETGRNYMLRIELKIP